MPRNYLRTLLLVVAASTCGPAQDAALSVLRVPDSLQTGNSVVISSDEWLEVTDLHTAVYGYRQVVSLLDEREAHANVHTVFYDGDSKITTFNASSYDRFGNRMARVKSADIADRRYTSEVSFYEDNRYQQVTVPCPQYPCTVVVEVEKKVADFSMIAGLPHWRPQQREQGVLQSSFTVRVPQDNELLYEGHQLREPVISQDGRNRQYRWEVNHLVPQKDEPYAPSALATLPYLRIALADFAIEGYRGSYRNWKDFGTFIHSIMDGRDVLPPRLQAEVREVVAGATTDYERVDRLYRFMQQRMRYVSIQLGIGGWQPFSADYVEQNRFGDCKALSNYMGALLKEVGIPSYPVLINWNDAQSYPVTEDFTSSAFNHMVLYVPSEEMYLECTSHTAPTGYLGEGKQDRNVLWITPEGGELHRTPSFEPSEHGHTRTVTVQLAADGATELDITASFYGGAQELFRSLTDAIPSQRDQLDWLHRNGYLPDVSGTDYQMTLHAATPRADVRYTTRVNDYGRAMGSRRFVPINPYYQQDWVPAAEEDRQLPVETYETRFLVDTVNLRLPAGYEIESGLVDQPIVYTHAAGEYRAVMRPTEDGLQWIRTLKRVPVRLAPSAYDGFRQFHLDVAAADRAQIVIREKRTK